MTENLYPTTPIDRTREAAATARNREMDALVAIIAALEPFNAVTRERMLRYVWARMLPAGPEDGR